MGFHPMTKLPLFHLTHEDIEDGHRMTISSLGRTTTHIDLIDRPPDNSNLPLRYAFCKYGSSGMDLFDFGLFAQLSYLNIEAPEEQRLLQLLFPDFHLRAMVPIGGTNTPLFYHFDSPEKNLSVIAIRGTE